MKILPLFPENQHVSKVKETYKSPFEKKRELEIKKLSNKVEKVRDEQEEQKRTLIQFTSNIKEQQLQVLQTEVK